MSKVIFIITLVLCCLSPVSYAANEIYLIEPEKVGLSTNRLKRLDELIDTHIEDKTIAGAVVLVARKGKIAYFHGSGLADTGKPIQQDTIFRVMSMTKPLTSTAIMLLYEEGKLLLSDPVSKYIPEFKGPKVLEIDEEGTNFEFKLVPSKREITVRDLLSHRSGLVYLMSSNWSQEKNRSFIIDFYKEAGITDGFCRPDEEIGDMVKRLARLPLFAQPGEVWEYGLSTDVLGYLIEVVSGMKLDQFMRQHIFDPLKMSDSHFYLPKEKLGRLSAVWISNDQGSFDKANDKPVINGNLALCPDDAYSPAGKYLAGGTGVLSTAYDYYRFAQMLLNQGELEGVRLLSRKTVELMTATNHIGDLDATYLHGSGWKFGLGFAIQTDRGQDVDSGTIGVYEWAGIYSTRFSIDPKEEKITLFLSQTVPFKNHFSLWDKILVLSNSAIVD